MLVLIPRGSLHVIPLGRAPTQKLWVFYNPVIRFNDQSHTLNLETQVYSSVSTETSTPEHPKEK